MRTSLHRRPRLERLEDRLAPSFGAIGPEFRVNSYTTNGQRFPAVASDADGDAVVVWTSDGQDGSSYGVYAQRFSSTGLVLGSEFRVNAYTTMEQFNAAVAMSAAGDFVVVWEGFGQDDPSRGVYGQRYSSAGTALGGEFRVTAYTTGVETKPAVAMTPDGDFVVVWTSYGGDGSGASISAQRFDAAGAPRGVELQVNTYTTSNQDSPKVAVDADGDFVVAWSSLNQDGSIFGVVARRFAVAGAALGAEVLVNTFTTGVQFNPVVAANLPGDFVVAWESWTEDSGTIGVYGQRFTSSGLRQGTVFRANTYTTGDQIEPSIAMDIDGSFVIAWTSSVQDGDAAGVYARRFDQSGAPLANEFRVNARTFGPQTSPAVGVDADGDCVIAWQSYGQDGNHWGVYAQRYIDVDNNEDTAGPAVVAITPAGAFAAIRPDARLAATVTGLVVAFTENVLATGGATGPYSVTNPANYRLTRNGTDINARISGIGYGYNPNTNRHEAVLNLSSALTDGLYALTVRSTIVDPTTNRLDGGMNGSGFGADFTLAFTVAAPVPAGPEVRTNSTTAGSQAKPSVASDSAGNYVVAWSSNGQDGSGYGIFAQRYDAARVPQGPEFRVNSYFTGNQFDPSVAMSAAGDFVVVWESYGQDGSNAGVYGQRYTAAGVPVGAEFRANGTTTEIQGNPDVAMSAVGEFFVTWQSSSQDGSGYGIYARRYNAAGTAFGSEFRVNVHTTGQQVEPTVAASAAGDLVFAWEDGSRDGHSWGIYARRYSASGLPIGGEFLVNTVTASSQQKPAVAMGTAGDFVVAWQSNNQDGGSWGIYSQRYSASGAPLGGEFQVNAFTTGLQITPVVAMSAIGDTVIAWESYGQDGNFNEVYAQRYGPAGAPAGAEFRVNTFTDNNQGNLAAVMSAAGDFIVVWQSLGQDGNGAGVYAQHYARTVAVESVRSIGSAVPIAPGGVVVAPVSQLVVTVSGPLAATGAGSVTDVANWQLSRYGAIASAAITGIDFGLNVANNEFEAILSLSPPLYDARYTLTALPAILDLDGRALDGDFDGTPGGAFALTFDVKPVPARGPETQVNSSTTGNQSDVAVAMDAAGNYVVVWEGLGEGSASTTDIFAQRYSAAGALQGGQFRVNTFTSSNQFAAAVAMSATGDFVVVWQSNIQDGSNDSVYARAYFASGTPQGGEFRVNTHTTGSQATPAIGTDAAGDFVVTWTSYGQDGSGGGVYARRYSPLGLLGPEFQVNQYTTDSQYHPAVAVDGDGDFVVAWESLEQDGGFGVYARQYSAAGVPLGNEFRVNVTATSRRPTVGTDAAGDFIVSWTSLGQDGSDYGVYARRFTAAGVPLGSDFLVHTYTTLDQAASSIAVDAAGDFVVTWMSQGQDGDSLGIFARRYGADGTALGAEFRVNTHTTGTQAEPKVAVDAIGNYVVAWGSNGQDGSLTSVHSQRYVANLTPATSGLPNVNIPVSPPTEINLAAGFSDIEDGSAGLSYSIVGNTNAALFTSAVINVTTLTLTPAGPGGSAMLTVRGADSGGSFVETSFTVTVAGTPPPQVTATQVNAGAAQRSRVTELTVTFSTQVTFAGAVASAFTLTRNGGGAVDFTATANVVGGFTVVTLNAFTSAATDFGSLRDGRYTLTALQSQISAGGVALDGDGNGTGGDDFTFTDAQGLFRFYGDMNGDRRVDISDFGFFSLAFLQAPNYNASLDFNADGRIDIADFGQFSVRFFTTLP